MWSYGCVFWYTGFVSPLHCSASLANVEASSRLASWNIFGTPNLFVMVVWPHRVCQRNKRFNAPAPCIKYSMFSLSFDSFGLPRIDFYFESLRWFLFSGVYGVIKSQCVIFDMLYLSLTKKTSENSWHFSKKLPDAATMESKVGPSVVKARNTQENQLEQIYESTTFHHNSIHTSFQKIESSPNVSS